MTDDQIKRLLELQKRFDAGEISKEMFDLGVAAIRGADKSNADSSQADTKPAPHKKRNIIIAVISAVVVLLSLGLFLLLHNKDKGEIQMGPMDVNFPDDYRVMNVVERYCTAICENDFTTLASLYAPTVERYQDAYDKDRDYVIGCHQRYDNTFKVHDKHSSIRRETFKMEPISNDRVSVVVVEDYSIDREDKSKCSVFVIEKHFTIDSTYHIVSVYDNQWSKSKKDVLVITDKKIKRNYIFKASQIPDVHYGEFTVDVAWPTTSDEVDLSKFHRKLLLGATSIEQLIKREIQNTFPSNLWVAVKEKNETESNELMSGDYLPYSPAGDITIKRMWEDNSVGLFSYGVSLTHDVGTGTQFGIMYDYFEVIYDIYNDMTIDYQTIFREDSYKYILHFLKTKPVYYYNYAGVDISQVNRVPTDFFLANGVCYFSFEREEIGCVADGNVALGVPIKELLPYMTPYGQSVFSPYQK